MVSYKHPWNAEIAATTLDRTGMYEASANLMWLNPFFPQAQPHSRSLVTHHIGPIWWNQLTNS